MASYLKPRRGAYSAISSTVLQSGEIFFETPNGVGGGKGRIMMGNASNTYAQLAGSSKYFLDIDSSPVAYSNFTGSDSTATNTFSNLAGSLGSGTVTLPTLVRVVKRALYNMSAVYAKLNSDKVSTSAIAKSTSQQTQITSSNASIYYKIFLNNVVMVYIGDPKNLPTNTLTQLATLPSSIVPKNIVYHDTQNLSDNKVVRFAIHPDGKLYAYNYSGTIGTNPANIGMNIVYLV